MSGHTPGPWEATKSSVQRHNGASDTLVAVTETHDIGGEEAEVNARLIAAAPDLLAAAKEAYVALPMTKHNESINAMLKAAIAKAEER